MFIRVKLLNGFQETLIYKVPEHWNTDNLMGSIVKVPLQRRLEAALVDHIFDILPFSVNFTIRPAHSQECLPIDHLYEKFITKLSSYYAIDKVSLFKRVRQFLKEEEQSASFTANTFPSTISSAVFLTDEQQAIVDTIAPAIEKQQYYPAVLYGVTGSGKTEIYKHLIIKALNKGKTVALLLPEVSLALQFTQLLKKQLPNDIQLFGFHSASSVKDKKTVWNNLLHNQPLVIIGVHLPMLLPLPQLGLIIVDEEHEIGFQEKKHPKIHTKEAALMRAQLYNCPIILGSATPSLTSLYNVKTRGWHLFELKKRFSGAFPTITLVKLAKDFNRKNFWISRELENAIEEKLAKKEQVIIFLNRRGYSFFIQCKDCGFIPLCIHCSVSLTLHNNQQLICHYCNFTLPEPTQCTQCKAPEKALLKKGIGTQQVVTILEKMFPQARIARADLDTTINKKNWQQTITNFELQKIDILVGTQTITKGYHFPHVTLVGILWADINLSLPVYNAAEVTLQQLIQVAGRAGRQSPESVVIVQKMVNHPLFSYINEVDYITFYNHEIENRKLVQYPPIVRLVEIELRHKDEALVVKEAENLANELIEKSNQSNLSITLLGPAQPSVHRIKNISIRKLYLKSASIKELLALYKGINKRSYISSILFTPNPLSM